MSKIKASILLLFSTSCVSSNRLDFEDKYQRSRTLQYLDDRLMEECNGHLELWQTLEEDGSKRYIIMCIEFNKGNENEEGKN